MIDPVLRSAYDIPTDLELGSDRSRRGVVAAEVDSSSLD